MNAVLNAPESGRTSRYAQIVRLSKKSEWQIDRDLLQDRQFDFTRKFLPDGLSHVDKLPFLIPGDARLLSQVQGRTYAYIFGLVERFISAKMLDQGRAHALEDQHALEALVRFTNDEIKHQELFRRVEEMVGEQMPAGYRQTANPDDVARAVLAASTWSVLALTCHIELFTLAHYKHKKKYYLMTKQGVYNFSKRQFQCLQCATDGLTAKETARLLHLSPRTVENYIEIARIKLNCKNKTQLAAFLDSKI
jgi:DNA-binding CsgD family transcriptional regulator